MESLAASSDDAVILTVMTNPEPDDVGTLLDDNSAVVDADPSRPHPADLLEVEGRMPWVGLE